MDGVIEAVIFDMDGVLIDSEHLWRKAMVKGFAESGLNVSEDECRQTMGRRIGEVIRYWIRQRNVPAEPQAVEERITGHLLELIDSEGKAIDGAGELVQFCLANNYRIGLATSSSNKLMNAVLKKLEMQQTFHAALSAEHMEYGKPHPQVFIETAIALGVKPAECLVIEDSLNGVIAGKAAGMQVIAVPDDEHTKMQQFAVADHKMNSMKETLGLFRRMSHQWRGTGTTAEKINER
jgi:mannitol-1-/sugar-/sorbitol-6-/2-deoxyglucose-6-phosphatase